MKHYLLAAIALLAAVATAEARGIVPQPLSETVHTNAFVVVPSTTLVCNEASLQPLVGYVGEYINLRVAEKAPSQNYISIGIDTTLAEEEYRLIVTHEAVRIEGGGYGGAFNGVQTLFQLLPSAIYTKQMRLPAVVRGCDVQDKPKFRYRGFMLDVARTFMEKENVLRYIDYIAYHKINKLHWHLTDNQGWRIEIKSHPDLARVGGYRGVNTPLRASLGKYDETYGGYYTQEDIREVVAYATVRNVEIIPEIDLPGHSEALMRIYPEMLCRYENKYVAVNGGYDARNVVCATREQNYVILEDIIKEVCALFPSRHFHVGGDEVKMSQWWQCPDCSAWLRKRGYTDGYKLEDMFISRIQAILAKYGKSPSVWNEAAFGGGLSKEALVCGWKSAKVCKQVMAKGYRTIFMPQEFFYLDMSQGRGEKGAIWAGPFDARKTYSFDFAAEGFSPEEVARVEGFEAPYWSEVFLSQGGDKSIDFIEQMTFPRLCALAEQGWGKYGGEWEEFHTRLYTRHYDRMTDMGINYRITPPTVDYKDGRLVVNAVDNGTIYYREEFSTEVHRYRGPIATPHPGKYVVWSEYRGIRSPEVAHESQYATIRPRVTLTSSIPAVPGEGYDRVAEYYSKMTTTRTCYEGDWFLFEFEEPVDCRAMVLYTGNMASPTRMFIKGYIELSEDGKSFYRAGELDYGFARLVAPRPIKAARLVCTYTSAGASNLRVGAPLIYPKWE